MLLALALSWCFLLSWLASVIELAPIVGAFAAGLVLESVHYRSFVDKGEHELEELIAPIAGFLVPVFFVVMGMRTDLASFADTRVLGLAAALTVAAVIGKQVCGLAVVGGGVDRVTVGPGHDPPRRGRPHLRGHGDGARAGGDADHHARRCTPRSWSW